MSSVTYWGELTGADESPPISDLRFKINAFSATIKNGVPSYCSVVIPTLAYSDQINERLNGDIRVIHVLNGVESVIALVNLDNIREDVGGTSESMTLSGNKQETYVSPKTVALPALTYRTVSNGIRKWRCRVLPEVLPGDTVTYKGESFVVDFLSIGVTDGRESLEISEFPGP